MTSVAPRLRITETDKTKTGPTVRVSATVQGRTLWFESNDLDLTSAPEVFASALLVPALDAGVTLAFDTALSSTWLANCRKLLEIYSGWWGYPELLPASPIGIVERGAPRPRTALCFTGGVDSFHTLLTRAEKIDYLIYAEGFDTPLSDIVRLRSIETSIRDVARQSGMTAAFIRTNLRELPIVARANWERAHGGALAALGHVLSGEVGRFVISSSLSYNTPRPWGTHWLTDHLWSSERTEIIQHGHEVSRFQKLRRIVSNPLVRAHLRVCWEHLGPEWNCSRCDKCLRVRLGLLELGELHNFNGFDGAATLARDLDSVPVARRVTPTHKRILAQRQVDVEVLAALERLVARTERALGNAHAAAEPHRFKWSRFVRFPGGKH